MPFLSGKDREEVKERTRRTCGSCEQEVFSEYCSRCDEFYDVGHKQNCTALGNRHEPNTCGGDRGFR